MEEARPNRIEASRPITEGFWQRDSLSGPEIEQLMAEWDRFRYVMLAFLENYDAIVCPTDCRPASLHGVKDALRFNYTLPYSLTGWPCVVVRAGTLLTLRQSVPLIDCLSLQI